MEFISLNDCCEILDSMRIPITSANREKGLYPYYGANGIQDYVANYIFDDELVLLAEDGGNFGSKVKPIAYRVSGKCWVNNHAHVLKPKEGFDVDYLCYSLMFYNVDGLVNGATRQKLTQSMMKKMLIPNRSLPEQLIIVEYLNKVIAIKTKLQSIVQKLDNLIKARFVEMFGSPITNDKNFVVKKVIEVVKLQRGHDLPIQSRIQNSTIPVWGSNGIVGYHNEAKSNSGIITGRSGTLGKVYYYDHPFWPLNTTLYSINTYNNNIIYLKYLLEFYELQRFASGTGVPTLNRNEFHNEMIIDVPLVLQNEFADFVKQVDKSKLAVQQSLDKTQELFDSLMQKYFG